ncbi:MAG TPA: hypothetical protein VHS13_04305, partial [Edaphobacter sp.]|nr:hypothetical protein [Edaphobacter sp.]
MRFSSLWRCSVIGVAAAMLPLTGVAADQKGQKPPQNYDKAARATLLHDANVYVAADADAQKVSLVTPGHEVVIVERSAPWVKVFANTDVGDDANEDDRNKPEFGDDANVTPASGWIRDKGVVGSSTPGGDAILF